MYYVFIGGHEGAIIPISETPDKKACNPKNITYLVYRGNGNYELYEDDGETEKYKSGAYAITYSSVIEKDNSATFKMLAPKGDKSVVPYKRTIKICFRDILGGNITVLRNDIEDSDAKIKIENGVNVEIFSVNASENIEILIKDYIAVTTQNSYKKACVSLLSKYNADNNFKLQTAYPFIAAQTLEQSKEIINLSNLPKIVKDALSELML